jgi:hypothetical protein
MHAIDLHRGCIGEWAFSAAKTLTSFARQTTVHTDNMSTLNEIRVIQTWTGELKKINGFSRVRSETFTSQQQRHRSTCAISIPLIANSCSIGAKGELSVKSRCWLSRDGG